MVCRYLAKFTTGLFIFFVGTAQAGPFGLDKGMSVEAVKRATGGTLEKRKNFVYRTTRVPKPHTEFESYTFIISPTTGLCKIQAIGKDIDNDSYGSEIQSRVERLSEQLTKTYGKPSNEFDHLLAGSIWDGASEWMMALSKNERAFVKYWTKASGLNHGITGIELKAHGLSQSKGFVTLGYEFDDGACIDEMRASDAQAL